MERTRLNVDMMETLEVAMAYFHPKEEIFSKERQESHRREAFNTLYKAFESKGSDAEIEELEESFNSGDKERFYDFVDSYITF